MANRYEYFFGYTLHGHALNVEILTFTNNVFQLFGFSVKALR